MCPNLTGSVHYVIKENVLLGVFLSFMMEIKAIFLETRTMFHFIFDMDNVEGAPINVNNHKGRRSII